MGKFLKNLKYQFEDKIQVYDCSEIDSYSDSIELFDEIQNERGKIKNIKCVNPSDTYFYSDLLEYKTNFTEEMYNKTSNIIFDSLDKTMYFKKNVKELMITTNKPKKESNPSDIKYYEKDGMLVKFENDTFYLQDKNKNWYPSPSTKDDYYEFIADFKEIDNVQLVKKRV